MIPDRGTGLQMRTDWGTLTCLHCQRVVKKVNWNQVTCGRESCKSAQQAVKDKRRGKAPRGRQQ